MVQQRFTKFLETRAAQEREAGLFECKPFKLTPGQYAELKSEAGPTWNGTSFATCQGIHDVQQIEHNIRATGDNVILCPRDDLFQESDSAVGVQLVSTANAVTSVPDNIGCVEVLSVGPLVDCGVKAGDIAFLDFFRVKQGYIVGNEECYISGGDAFAALYDPITQDILPLDNHIVTKAAKDRFAIALSGSELVRPSDIVLTDGFTSGKTSKGSAAAKTTYHEVVRLGKLTATPRPGVMTKNERKLLDTLTSDGIRINLIHAVLEERENGRESDIAVGDLVGVCEEIALKVRVRGEYRWIAPYNNALAIIDDEAILKASRERNKPRSRILRAV